LKVKAEDAAQWTVEGVRLSESPMAKKVEGGFELEAGSYRLVKDREQGTGTRD